MRIRHLAAFTAASALVLSAPAYVGQAAAEEPVEPAAETSSEQLAAEEALETVEALLGDAPAQDVDSAVEHADATLALNDLRLRLNDLTPTDRRTAKTYFGRPDGVASQIAPYSVPEAPPVCGAHICVHYVASTNDAPPAGSALGDPAVNDWAETTLAVAEDAWNRIVTLSGYNAPLSDATSPENGGNALLDIYLSDTGGENQGLFGMCTTDDPAAFNPVQPALRFSAFCAVDNAFDNWGGVPLDLMRVTVVHEFFHAVQFTYDGAEDKWLMEGTAAWIEDELYDDVNDNLNYIHPDAIANPLTKPHQPLDRFGGSYRNYGVWTFWKRLSERYPAKQGQLPKVILDVWRRAGGLTRSGASTMALSRVLEDRDTSFGAFFTKWGVGNRFPRRSYSEGAALHYPAAPLERGFALSKRRRSIGWQTDRLNHMTNAHYRFKPKGLTGKRWRIRVEVDGPARVRGPYATLVVYKKSGAIKQVRIKLDRQGDGAKRVRFGKGSVRRVELTLTNASNRFRGCYPAQDYSDYTCGGQSRDDRQRFLFRARVTR